MPSPQSQMKRLPGNFAVTSLYRPLCQKSHQKSTVREIDLLSLLVRELQRVLLRPLVNAHLSCLSLLLVPCIPPLRNNALLLRASSLFIISRGVPCSTPCSFTLTQFLHVSKTHLLLLSLSVPFPFPPASPARCVLNHPPVPRAVTF